MSAVKSRGNVSTELALIKLFRKERIAGWRRNKKIFGIRPDFIFPKKRIAVFVHGCFWHGCHKHRPLPDTSKVFWRKKITANMIRDYNQKKLLRKNGWTAKTVWEHELREGSVPRAIGELF